MSKLEALFIGNCHNDGIIHFLLKSDDFKKTYNIKKYANWQLIENSSSIPIRDIQDADLFIYQPLPAVHGCYSTDPTVCGSIGSFVKDSCMKISYPYAYCSALWPLVQAGKNDNRWFGNEPIDKLLSQGLSLNDILDMYDQNLIDWEYKNRLKETLSILEGKEKITDIKISSFIKDNLSNRALFLIPQHPTSIIFLNLANEILNRLGMDILGEDKIISINDAGLPDSTYDIPSGMFPIDISTIKDLSLKFADEFVLNSKQFYKNRIEDYIKNNIKNG